MCLQCFTAPVEFGAPLKGFHLKRARRNGDWWLRGEWALIEMNDPTYTWISTPKIIDVNAFTGMVPEDFDTTINNDAYATTSYKLISACIEKGYVFSVNNPPQHFTEWLFNYLAQWINSYTAPHYEADYIDKETVGNDIDTTIDGKSHPSEEEAIKKWMEE